MAGIYLHIPFCQHRCLYCDFYSTVRKELREAYIHALCRELGTRRSYIKGKVETLYLGGGTPSLLHEEDFGRLFDCLERFYGLSDCREITIEANPDDLNEVYVQMLRRFPFNRISIGIQTFNDGMLRLLRRRHTARQAIEAVRCCQEAGFSNLSIDLIFGLPGETTEHWAADLRQAIALEVQHISTYHLTYEEGTPLWQLREQHQIEEIDEEQSLALFTQGIETLTQAGYEHYEISNYCRPGFHSRHNSAYWAEKPYLGCGPSAHSYDGISRQANVSSLETYIREVERTGIPPFEREELNLYTRYNDLIVTSLRTRRGLSLSDLRERFGEQLYRYALQNARPHMERGLLVQENNILRLTRKGLFLSDGILCDLLWVEE